MDHSKVSEGASRRLHSSKQPAPPPPQKVRKCDSLDDEVKEEDAPPTLTATNHEDLLKQSREQSTEPQGLGFRKLDDLYSENDIGAGSQTKAVEDQKSSLAHSGERLLATFYGMLYTNDGAEKGWKLEVDDFIAVCCVQVHGNANKPFKIIAVEKCKRTMECLVTGNTTCARNSTFVKWQDGSSMFGVRFAKEDQAEQFFSTVKRMASTLAKAAQLLKQTERKDVIRKITDAASASNIHHTKVSLMIKLPDKQTTIMSVPGLLTMSELFEMICEKEHLNSAEHQLSLPRTGTRRVTFDSGTAVGSLKIREVSIIRTVLSDNNCIGLAEPEEEFPEDLLDFEGEESKILQISLPAGVRKSYRVSLDTTMRQLVTRVCSRERLNPRHHSLQYIDFKHEFLDMASTVDEIEVSQIRLMDKRGRNLSRASVTDDDSPSNSPVNTKFRRSSGIDLESDSSSTVSGEDKESLVSWRRSKSMDVLSDDGDADVFTQQDETDLPRPPAANGTVPTALRRNSSGGITRKKLPVMPLPYATKSSTLPKKPSRELHNGALHSFSPIKKDGILSASTPDLSISPKFDNSHGTSSIKTSTPDNKSKRRAAPPPPNRPAAPKALFTNGKSVSQTVGATFPVKNPTPAARNNPLQAPPIIPTPTPRGIASQAASGSDAKLKPSHKKRPAPPRPSRPAPPQPARQSSTESRDSKGSDDGTDSRRKLKAQFKEDSLSLELPRSDCEEERENDWRGVPIFIPPPPPDELPPPLDECETPVGPLTDLEADILEGSGNENFPTTVNGFVDFDKYLIPSPRQTNQNEAVRAESGDRVSVLETVPEYGSFPVVPPPPMYSESVESSSDKIHPLADQAVVSNKKKPSSTPQGLSLEKSNSGLTDIPPPLLETEVASTSQDAEEKDHDSGFDQSPEILRTPPTGPLEDVSEQSWENGDSGSSLDVISAIPPPIDFASTRPLTPPCQFVNSAVVPPEGFVEEWEPEQPKSRKKLNVSGDSFPWTNEPQAPLNATVLPAVSGDTGKDPELELVNNDKKIPFGENVQTISKQQGYGETLTQSGPVVKTADSSVAQESKCEGSENPCKPELKKAKEIIELTVGKGNVKENQGVGTKPVKPEPNPKPVKMVKGANVQNEPITGVQQFVPNSLNASNTVTQPEPQIEAQVVSGTMVEDAAHSSCVISVPRDSTRPELQAEPVTLGQQFKQEKAETLAEPVKVVEGPNPSSFTLSLDVSKPGALGEPVKTEAEPKPETKRDMGAFVRETEAQVQAHLASSFTPPIEDVRPKQVVAPAKPEVQAKAEQQETRNKPVTFVKVTGVEGGAKVDVQQFIASSKEPHIEQVVQAKPEKIQSSFVEEVITPQMKPEVEASLNVVYQKLSESSLDSQEIASQSSFPSQETAVTLINVGEENGVVETPVKPETKATRSSYDRLRDLEDRLQELDKGATSPLSSFGKPNAETAPKPSQEVTALRKKDPFVEDVIVAQTKQVDFLSYNQFEELLKMTSREDSVEDIIRTANKNDDVVESQYSLSESSSSRTDAGPELRLDLSSLRQSPEPPRPSSCSPPATTPKSSILSSPRDLPSDRSTESGISIHGETKIPSDSVEPVGDKETQAVENCSTQTEVQDDNRINNTAMAGKPQTRDKPSKMTRKLQRPLSMPSGILRDFKGETVSEAQQSVTDSDSRKPSSSDSTGVSSLSSLPSSPVESGSTGDPTELPKLPPFTAPPLRRFSDLASDLSFISSAAKAAEKTQESETKTDAPTKSANLVLKRSVVSVEERPRSWMAPETSSNKRSTMWSSAFKPVSFDAQAKKAARPVAFDAKSFSAPSVSANVPTAGSVTSVGKSEMASITERRTSPRALEKSSESTPLIPEKLSREPTVPLTVAKEETLSRNQPVSTVTNVTPLLKKSEPRETKYEIVLSKHSSESQGASEDVQGKSSKVLSSSASIREQIMRDASAGNRVTRPRPQSAIVGGSKFQILPKDTKLPVNTKGGWADVKKLAALQTAGVKTETPRTYTKRQSDEPSTADMPALVAAKPLQPVKSEDANPEALKPQTVNKPDNKLLALKKEDLKPPKTEPQAVKAADLKPKHLKATDITAEPVTDSTSLPTVVMRTKTADQDPAKRLSMPAYIIEGPDRKPPSKRNSSGGQFHFITNDVKMDTTVVPPGVVAAMKALREKGKY